MKALAYAERPADGVPQGLLILHHGRGTNEHDLLGLADVLDPGRRLHVITPRAPMLIGSGYHWYVVRRVGYPDTDTFGQAREKLAAFHDELWRTTGVTPERTVLGGFSMGAVMSYTLGLSSDRPIPAGIMAFSGFIPTVDGWQPDTTSRPDLPVFISHGRQDLIITVDFAREAKAQLTGAGLPVEYHESDAAHYIDPSHIPTAVEWLGARLPGGA